MKTKHGMNRLVSVVEGSIAMLLVLLPSLALAASAVRATTLRWSVKTLLPWGLVWLPLLLLSIVRLPTGGAMLLGGQAALLILMGHTLRTARRTLWWGALLGLSIVLLSGAVEQGTERNSWQSYSYAKPVWQRFVEVIRGEERLEGRGLRSSFGQLWQVDPNTEVLEFSLEARLVSGRSGWTWYQHDPELELAFREGEGGFTRVFPASASTPYVSRRILLPELVAPTAFRVTIELRGSQPAQTDRCEGLRLGILFDPDYACLPLTLDREWQTYKLTTIISNTSTTPVLQVMLRGLPVDHYDLRNVLLEQQRGSTWWPVEPLEPNGALLRANLPEVPPAFRPSVTFLPTDRWQRITLPVNKPAELDRISFFLQLEGGLILATRNVALGTRTAGEKDPEQRSFESRSRLWFGHANLLGHSIAAVGSTLLSSMPPAWLSAWAILASLFGVSLTGSRAAWLALLLVVPWFVWLNTPTRWLRWVMAALIIAAIFGASTRLPGRLQNLQELRDGNSVTRTDIWRFAWQQMIEHPLTGVTERDFVEAWRRASDIPDLEPPRHAHNFWLHFASRYGVPGLLVAVWMSLGLTYLAWHWGRWRGLALVSTGFVLNTFDYSLFSIGVIMPLVIGLNLLRDTKLPSHLQPHLPSSGGGLDDRC